MLITLKFKQFLYLSRYCCKIDLPILTINQYSIVPYTYQTSQTVVVGTTDCGLFGWSSCDVHGTRYGTATAYKQQLNVYYKHDKCPTNFEVCCNGFVLVNGKCLRKL